MLGIALLAVVASACSNDGEKQSGRWTEAERSFYKGGAERTQEWANPVAEAYMARVAAGETGMYPAVLRQFQDETAALERFLCQEVENLRKLAGEGVGAQEESARVDHIRIGAKRIVIDATVSALLTQALSAPPAERDRLLAGLTVEAIGSDRVTKITGMAALEDAGIVSSGQLALPATESKGARQESPAYERYLDWYNQETDGFASKVGNLTGDIEARIEECASS